MDDRELGFATLTALADAIAARRVSSVELTEALLRRIERLDGRLNAFVTVVGDRARADAARADAEPPRGALHGVPVAIKDLDEVAGVRTTFGSLPLRDHVSERSSTCAERLVAAGAIVIAKTNTPEFGHKAITDNAITGPTSTPFDLACNAGGSSGGSAAAVAAGLVPLAQGGDGGGSIRIPAAMCGCYGFKATYGRVGQATRPHAFATHTPFVHVGPLTRTVRDAALALQVLSGHVPADPFSAPDDGADFVAAVERPVTGMRVGYLPDFGGYPVDADVRARVDAGAAALAAAGAHVEEVSAPLPLPHGELTDLWLRHMGIGWAGIVAGFRAQGIDLLGDHREQLSAEFVAVVEAAERRTVRETHADYLERSRIFDWAEDLLIRYDLLIGPVAGVSHVPNRADRRTLGPATVAGVPVEPTIGWCPTVPLNFSGHPAASVPVGLTASGHPVGMQIAGRRFADGDVLAASAAVERELPWAPVLEELDR